MKKLKIFLLLSILLCFGFVLSSEVHAQGSPKLFEVNDVLPQGLVKITGMFYSSGEFYIELNDVRFMSKGEDSTNFEFDSYFDSFLVEDNTNYSTGTINAIYNFSSLSESERTVNWGFFYGNNKVYWEEYIAGYSVTFEENGGTSVTDLSGQTVLPNPLPIPSKENHTFLGWYYDSSLTIRAFPGDTLTDDIVLYAKWGSGKVFEVGDVLPQGIIRVSWDETTWYKMHRVFGDSDDGNQIKSSNNTFNFIEQIGTNYYVGGIPVLYIPEPGNLEFYPPYTVYGGGHAYVDINTAGWDLAKRTIFSVIWSEYLTSRLYWEDITPDGYTQGYLAAKEYYGWEDDGYWYTGEEAWDMGNEYARGVYGYYDPITKEWLSVSEYLELYGTDKMSQTDFYNNFDKYFIPAMIIVFGAAIVLTLLKVFKGRE